MIVNDWLAVTYFQQQVKGSWQLALKLNFEDNNFEDNKPLGETYILTTINNIIWAEL